MAPTWAVPGLLDLSSSLDLSYEIHLDLNP